MAQSVTYPVTRTEPTGIVAVGENVRGETRAAAVYVFETEKSRTSVARRGGFSL